MSSLPVSRAMQDVSELHMLVSSRVAIPEFLRASFLIVIGAERSLRTA